MGAARGCRTAGRQTLNSHAYQSVNVEQLMASNTDDEQTIWQRWSVYVWMISGSDHSALAAMRAGLYIGSQQRRPRDGAGARSADRGHNRGRRVSLQIGYQVSSRGLRIRYYFWSGLRRPGACRPTTQ